MNGLNTFLSSALESVSSILGGTTCTYSGVSITGIFNTVSDESELITGGLNPEKNTTILFNNTDITTAGITFQKGKKATIDSADYKIMSIDSGAVTTTLTLGDWNVSTI